MKKRFTFFSLGVLGIIFFVLSITGFTSQAYQSGRNLYHELELFHSVLQTIQTNYVDEKEPHELVLHAINGMISDLDPHTNYMTAEEFNQWNQRFEGYSGIGIYFDVLKDKITVLSVIRGGPSEMIGLRAGDRIIAIDGESVIGIKRDDVPLKLMGPEGTQVTITVERTGLKQPFTYTIIRKAIHLQSVPFSFVLKPDIGYINVTRFASTTEEEFGRALEKLEKEGINSLIIDLRNNGGGYMDAAVKMSDHFLPGGKRIVFTKGRIPDSYREFYSTGRMTKRLYPVIIMQNRSSASASEIVAGALQDWDRGLIVGEASFGKGLVQSQFQFDDGSALLVTTAKYYTPTGRVIQRPYSDKSFEEYYTEVYSDTFNQANLDHTNQSEYKTMVLQREVYGGGGITPDVFLKADSDSISTILGRLVLSPKRLFFSFVQQYSKKNPEIGRDFNQFLAEYQPDTEALNSFYAYIQTEGFKMAREQFQENLDDIRFMLKQHLAAAIWGEEARYKTQMLRDKQLVEAVTYLPRASELVKKAYGN